MDIKITGGVTTVKLTATEARQMEATAATCDGLAVAFKGAGGYAELASRLLEIVKALGPKPAAKVATK